MDKPLLSICIPTYNRCSYLQNSLNSIICQKEFLNGTVEIVISDNASTDGTQKFCEQYASCFKNIRYFRNEENIHDRNFPLALSRGNGIYQRLSNDNSLYLPNSLHILCGIITKYKATKPVLFLLNGKRKTNESIIECKGFAHFVQVVSSQSTWLGGFGIWDCERERITNDLSGLELKLWQCVRIYEMVADLGGAVVINYPILKTAEIVGRDLSYGVFQTLYLDFFSILQSYLDKGMITQDIVDRIRVVKLCEYARTIVVSKNRKMDVHMSARENLYGLVFNEIQTLGATQHFLKLYKKESIVLPAKLLLKKVYLGIYSTFLSCRTRQIMKKARTIGV